MSDFKMKLGNFEAIPEKGDDNFATSIYEQEYDGLLIARCNQNGRYPEQARAMLDGLNGKKLALDEITALRSRAEKAEAERDELQKLYEAQGISAFKVMKEWQAKAEAAEATCEKLAAALEKFAKAGQVIDGPFGPALFVEDDMAFQSGCAWSENGVRTTITWGDFRRARSALSEYRKEASNAG